MSNIVYESRSNNIEFNISKNLKGLKTKKPNFTGKDIRKTYLNFDESKYSLCQDICVLVDYNTKGLLENIIYLKMLMKKGKFKISLDLFEKEFEGLLILNYKYNIFKEFCLINQYKVDYYKKYATEDDFHFYGMEFMLEVKAYLLWGQHIYETQTFNDAKTTRLDNIDFNNLTHAQEAIINTAIVEKKEVIINGCQRNDNIIKICNKIVKLQTNPYNISQIKKTDIKKIKIIDGETRDLKYSSVDIHFPLNFIIRLFPLESDDFKKFCNTNKYSLNIMKLFGDKFSDYKGYINLPYIYKDF